MDWLVLQINAVVTNFERVIREWSESNKGAKKDLRAPGGVCNGTKASNKSIPFKGGGRANRN